MEKEKIYMEKEKIWCFIASSFPEETAEAKIGSGLMDKFTDRSWKYHHIHSFEAIFTIPVILF